MAKTTIEIPDELYRKVKAKSALAGRSVREVTEELYRQWVDSGGTDAEAGDHAKWLESWLHLADETMRDAPRGPTAVEIVDEGRSRLDSSG